MRTFAVLLPAVLSAMILAAHFLRRGALLGTLACLALLVLLGTRRPWARPVIQGALGLGALEWTRTLFEFAIAREARSEPWLRMAIILIAVMALAILGAALLETAPARRRFQAESGAGLDSPPPPGSEAAGRE